jgi:glucose/arabinose dehydrogenase
MNRQVAGVVLASLLSMPSLAQTTISLTEVASGLNLSVGLTFAPGVPASLFVTEQRGKIREIRRSELQPEPFLDITQRVLCCGERGLLSVAFHPDFVTNGQFFVNYTDLTGATIVSRFRVFAADPRRGDPASEEVILEIAQPFSNHNGGQLQFGPDGYLYIGTGDGGSANDPGNRAQDRLDLLGKMLRIDVDGGSPYAIPPTNPFRNLVLTARPEIWASGLRNPWRFSFDRATGDLYIADVGQGRFEEVNIQPATSHGGENYGWRLMEASSCNLPSTGCSPGGLTLPILEYSHGAPGFHCSVTGGYVYRGRFSTLRGIYFYGDYCTGTIWGARAINGVWRNVITLDTTLRVSTFGEDHGGDLYVAHYLGTIYRIVTQSPPRQRPLRR